MTETICPSIPLSKHSPTVFWSWLIFSHHWQSSLVGEHWALIGSNGSKAFKFDWRYQKEIWQEGLEHRTYLVSDRVTEFSSAQLSREIVQASKGTISLSFVFQMSWCQVQKDESIGKRSLELLVYMLTSGYPPLCHVCQRTWLKQEKHLLWCLSAFLALGPSYTTLKDPGKIVGREVEQK